MDVKIRKMKLDDVLAVTRLHRNTIRKINGPDYPKKVIQTWSGRKTVDRLRTNFLKEQRFVAVANDQVVGFMNLSKDGKTLNALYIRQNYVGRGIGSVLIKKAEQIIRKSGAKKMTIDSSLTARDFYKKHGLKIIKSKLKLVNGVKVRIWSMSKEL